MFFQLRIGDLPLFQLKFGIITILPKKGQYRLVCLLMSASKFSQKLEQTELLQLQVEWFVQFKPLLSQAVIYLMGCFLRLFTEKLMTKLNGPFYNKFYAWKDLRLSGVNGLLDLSREGVLEFGLMMISVIISTRHSRSYARGMCCLLYCLT